MIKRNYLIVLITVTIIFFAITCITATSYMKSNETPLYILRMEQASSKMSFLPTVVSEFTYSTEKGYVLKCGPIRACEEDFIESTEAPCDTRETDGLCTYYEITCGSSCETCETCYTCEPSCGGSCEPTCSTCPPTCPYTCPATCPVTCDGYTCDQTSCQNTCSTCEGSTCIGPTCEETTCPDCPP